MLSITTLNTWKCDGRYAERLELMAAGLARLRPDVLLLQEAFAAPAAGLDTAAHLARALGYRYAVAEARVKQRRLGGQWLDSSSSLAALTRGAIRDSRAVKLSGDPEDGERLSQIVEIEIDSARLLVANLHLTYLPDRDALRRTELEETLAALPDPASFDAALLAGDFNCPPNSPPMAWLLQESGFRVTDPCAEAGKHFVTHERQPDLGRPAQRIDYVLQIEDPAAMAPLAIASVDRVLDVPDPALGITPSDHYGVSVTLARREG